MKKPCKHCGRAKRRHPRHWDIDLDKDGRINFTLGERGGSSNGKCKKYDPL